MPIKIEYALDWSWGRPDPAAVKAAGVNNVCRYLSHDKTGKTLTAAEAKSLLDAGLGVILNFEDSTSRPMGGHDAGVADGAFANALANSIGAPPWAPIVYSVDTDPGSPVNPQIVAYFAGLNAAGGRPVEAYGGAVLLRTLRAQHLIGTNSWNSNARSWDHGPTDPEAALLQLTTHPVAVAGFPPNQYDVSIVQHAPLCWGGSGSVKPHEDPKDGEMYLIRVKETGEIDLVGPTGKRHLANMDEVNLYSFMFGTRGLPTKPIDVSQAQANLIPNQPTGGSGGSAPSIDYAALAKAVNDDAAKRLAS